MKIKTSELTGPALDWAVAKCEGVDSEAARLFHSEGHYNYSTDWSQGGPIIERERIAIDYTAEGWYANMYWRGQDNTTGAGDSYRCGGDGPTSLIAAMRCYCASRLGEEADVPEELV